MGVGVSLAFAVAGHPVTLVDVDPGALNRCRERMLADIRFAALTGSPLGEPDRLLDLVTFTSDHTALGSATYLVENISENWPAKQALYQVLDDVCEPGCVLAANTSAIPITKIAGATSRPETVVGNHFMNPAHRMPTVEVIRGMRTSHDTVAAARTMLSAIGKRTVVVNDSPGFVTNRVLMLTVNEAMFVLAEGVSTAADIDLLFRQCFGHRMGPLETADLIGLDTVLYSLEVLYEEFGDPKYRPCPLLRRYVEAGLLGQKSGRGFRDYHGPAEPPQEDPDEHRA
jgi:3-hydroxybutyryl-CoA dehydrogenase